MSRRDPPLIASSHLSRSAHTFWELYPITPSPGASRRLPTAVPLANKCVLTTPEKLQAMESTGPLLRYGPGPLPVSPSRSSIISMRRDTQASEATPQRLVKTKSPSTVILSPDPTLRAMGEIPRKPLSLPYYRSRSTPSFALNGAPYTLESAATGSHPFVNQPLVSPVIPRRPTMEDLKPVLVKASPSEQPLPINHSRSCSVPVPLSPVVRRPPSSVAWHLPSRSRSMPKLRESLKHERSDSEHSLYGIQTPPPTATAVADRGS
jgi:hypothetical protein